MTTYQPDPDNPYSISGLGIRALHEGPTGDLWIGTWRNGLNHFDRATERFTSYRHHPEDPRSLSYDFVRFVHEDKHGEVWVITDHWQLDKLDRDTGTFTRYRHDPHDPSSLSDDWIARRFVAGVPAISFLEDREGTIWIGTFGAGLNRYDRATDSFTRFTSPTYSTNPPVPFHTLDTLDRTHRSIASILQVENVQQLTQSFEVAAETPVLIVAMGEFFLGQRADYGWLENEEGEVVWEMVLEQSYHAGGASDNRVQMETVLLAPGAYQLFYQSDGAHAFEHWTVAPPDRPERWGIQVYALTGTETFLAPENERKAAPGTIAGDYVFALLEDAAGMLWIGTSGGLSKHDRMTGTFTTYRSHQTGQKADPVYALYEDRRGRLWVVTRDAGLSRFDPKTGTFTPYGWDPDDPRRLSSNNLLPVHEEAEGRLWLLTNTEGINIFDPETTTVTRVRHDPGNPHSLGPGTIRSVYTDQTGILWVGTWQGSKETSILGGLHKMDPSTRKFQPYRLDSNGTGSLRNNIAEAICEDHQGVLWIGTSQTGLLRYDPATERYTGYRHDPENPTSLSHDFVSAIYEDRQGTLWIGTGSGLNRLDSDKLGHFTSYKHDRSDPNSLSQNRVLSILEDREGVLWVGTEGTGGLNQFNRETETFTSHASATTGLLSIVSLYEDRSDRLWVGTLHGGLHLFDRATGTSTRYTVQDGLSSNSVMGILEDDAGNLWISTINGLSVFNPATEDFRNYDTADGLQGNFFTANTAHRSESGRLFFGGEGGVTAIWPDQVTANPHPPKTALTGFLLLDRLVPIDEDSPLTAHVSVASSITLSHNQNDFSFDFVALHFSRSETNTYAYKLEPYEDAWRHVGTQRRATYTNMSPGAYVFRVKAANSDGVWDEEGASIRVVIKPPWWKTGWAYALYVLLLVAGIVAVDRIQRRHLLGKEREKARIREAKLRAENAEVQANEMRRANALKSRFLANISHEFRTPLTLTFGPLNDLLNGRYRSIDEARPLLERARTNGQRLLRLINQLLDLSKLDAGALTLQPQQRDLVAFLAQRLAAFESLADDRDLTLCFRPDRDTLPFCFDAEKLETVLLNLLSNAFKFTSEGGTITVAVHRDDAGAACLTVRDTGIGIPPDHLPYLFDRFYQVDASTTRAREGTGIGLALVRQLVELHDGAITVESEIDRGTTFTITLPARLPETSSTEDGVAAPDALPPTAPSLADAVLADLHAFAAPAPAPQSDETVDDEATVVLIVEDNADMRAYLRTHLDGRYHVEEAENGAVGLERAVALVPDLVLTDVMMPEMDGYALLAALKADERTSHVPVVLLTAKADAQSKIAGLKTGADDYLAKPFDGEVLRARVHNLIEQRRLLRAIYSRDGLGPMELGLPSMEAAFLAQVQEVVEENLNDSHFGVDALADAVAMSRRQVSRKLVALSDERPGALIRRMRLERAAAMLQQKTGRVNEVAFAVGFQGLAHFRRAFREAYGVAPSEY